MLKSLFISNFALISSLKINFENGMTVITGETGAGKSIILGALSLILGQRADARSIQPNADKCVIEAEFDVSGYKHLNEIFDLNELDFDGKVCLIRRELTSSGKSRAFINDTPVSLTLVKELGNKLIDIHSQHENLLLSNANYQLEVLDTVSKNQTLLIKYKSVYLQWLKLQKNLSALQVKAELAAAEADYVQFQFNQLQEASLNETEQTDLETEQQALTHAAEIKLELNKTVQLLEDEQAVLAMLKEATQHISRIQHYLPNGEEKLNRFQSSYIELKDLLVEISQTNDKVEINPVRLEWVENRLSEIYSLQKKYKVTSIAELIEKKAEFDQKLNEISSYDQEIELLQNEIDGVAATVKTLSDELYKNRTAHISVVESFVIEQLTKLGIPNIQFQVELNRLHEYNVLGQDQVQFLFSANKNRPLQPVQQIASGGEVARLMLALKALIADKSDLPTIFFDEIDTGVSGEIAHRMGDIMAELGIKMQVVTITHLPQIAAKGSAHFKVYKDESGQKTETFMLPLSYNERINELATMLSGNKPGEAAIQNAKELLSKIVKV
jgi:DNA repair protein RecN (Recombination protein N)